MTPLAHQLRMLASGSRPLGHCRAGHSALAERSAEAWKRSVVRNASGLMYASANQSPLPATGLQATGLQVTGLQVTGAQAALPQATGTIVGPIAPLARVEAVLFLAKESLSTRRIAQLANLEDATEARTLLTQLCRHYDQQERSFQVERVAEGYRLLTRPQFAPWISKLGTALGQSPTDLQLTPPALETLAVVAYRQPVMRAEVEAIRGVGCGELLRQLIDRDLLRIFGRSEELGRPLLYGTTKQFLQTFGLKNLTDLPPMDTPTTASSRSPSPGSNAEPNTTLKAA